MDKYLIEAGVLVIFSLIAWGLRKWVQSVEDSVKALQKNQGELDKEVEHIKEEIIDRLARIEGYLMRSNKDV